MCSVHDYGTPLVDDAARLAGVAALGVDETSFLKATRVAPTRWITGLVDLERGRLLEVVADRTRAAVAGWLGAPAWRLAGPHRHGGAGSLARVCQRPGHPAGPRQGGGGPLPRHPAGQHRGRPVRRRTQQATLGHRGRRYDPLYRTRKLLLTAAEQLTGRGRARLRAGLAAGDPGGEVAAAWQGKELLRAVYRAVGMPAARAALDRFYRWCDGVGVPELSRLARTVRAWEDELLAFHATGGCSNGPTEAVNLLIKKVKRVGHGFRNFANYRLRLLLYCGVSWQTHRTAKLRGRPHTW
jgi:transposase